MHSLGIVQWDSTRRDHPGYPGRVSGSSPVIDGFKGLGLGDFEGGPPFNFKFSGQMSRKRQWEKIMSGKKPVENPRDPKLRTKGE